MKNKTKLIRASRAGRISLGGIAKPNTWYRIGVDRFGAIHLYPIDIDALIPPTVGPKGPAGDSGANRPDVTAVFRSVNGGFGSP